MHTLNDDGVAQANMMAGKFKLAQDYSPFKSHFVGSLNTVLSHKNVLHDKNWTFHSTQVVDL